MVKALKVVFMAHNPEVESSSLSPTTTHLAISDASTSPYKQVGAFKHLAYIIGMCSLSTPSQ